MVFENESRKEKKKDHARRTHSRQKACQNKAVQSERAWLIAPSIFTLHSFKKTSVQGEAKTLLSLCGENYFTGQKDITLYLRALTQLSLHCFGQFALLLFETTISKSLTP